MFNEIEYEKCLSIDKHRYKHKYKHKYKLKCHQQQYVRCNNLCTQSLFNYFFIGWYVIKMACSLITNFSYQIALSFT